MRARAIVVAEVDDLGVTRLTRVRSEPPLLLRATAGGLYLVGGAGGPLGGDDLALDIEVGAGASLTVRSAAASVAQPGVGPSRLRITASVGPGGRLEWLPEPVVAARGCDHHLRTAVSVGVGGSVVWREEILLGRHAETPGSIVARFTADIDGVPLLRQEFALGLAHRHAESPAVAGVARAAGSMLLVGPEWGRCRPPATTLGAGGALLPLDGPAVQIVALAADALGLRRCLDAGLRVAGAHTAATAVP